MEFLFPNYFIVAGSQKVTYIYSASGGKLATNANGSLTYYRSVMVYGNDNKLLYILTPEGTVTRNEGSSGTTYTYNYFKRDQVGSTRAVLSAVGTTLQNVQSTDYYPFGLAHSTNNLNKNKYLFSGKELQDGTVNNQMLGLYDFGMRQYDAIIGRWTTLDLYALKYPGVSPYNYCLNNPMNLIDPFGLEPTKDSMSDGNGGWIYYYTLDEVTVTGTTSGGDKPSPGYQPYTPTWPGSIPTGMGDDGGPGYPGPVGGGGGGNGNNNGKPSNYVEKSSQNPKRSMKDKIGKKGYRFNKPFTLTDPKDVAEFLWYNSFQNGKPFTENAALLLNNGLYWILPNNNATLHNFPFTITGRDSKAYYNNQMVVEVIHTHPGSYTIDRLSDGDIRFMNQYPTTIFTIIINSTIYDVWPTGKYVPTGVVR